MCVQTVTSSPSTTGSVSLDRVLNYTAIKKTTDAAEGIIANHALLSNYVAPVAKQSVAVSVTVAGKVPGVKMVAGKVDEFGDRTLEKLESTFVTSQEKLSNYVKNTLPLDRDGGDNDEPVLSASGVKERVIVNGQKVVKKVVPENVVAVAGKSATAITTCYKGMTKENIKEAYSNCTLENAKKTTKAAYNECTYDNTVKVANVTATVAKAAVDISIATTKKVVGTTVATTKAGYGAAKEYTLGTSKTVHVTDAPPAEPETPVVEAD